MNMPTLAILIFIVMVMFFIGTYHIWEKVGDKVINYFKPKDKKEK